ncbi:MAG TPA: hypothetical protein PKG71_02660 [Candidatus Woesebacteria bacterium]|nr:hypothetical protein [Candidatus Woesebacteria bacterium]HNS94845.1 hypothetical protein [Candidatus Woesebacteria bacterium]
MNWRSVRAIFFFLFLALFLAFGLTMGYRAMLYRYNHDNSDTSKAQRALSDLSKVMVLPSTQPTVAVITNEKILQESFEVFKDAQDGDVVFVYPGKLIVFDPVNQKIRRLATPDTN